MAFAGKPRLRVLCVSPAHPPYDPRVLKTLTALAGYQPRCLLPWPHASSVGVLSVCPSLAWRLLRVHPVVIWSLLRYRPRILHLFMPELLPIALLYRLFGGRVVYDVQEHHRLKFERKPRNKQLLFRYLFHWFDSIARRYCYCLFSEESYRQEYRVLALPYRIIHNFPVYSPEKRLAKPPANRTDLCYLGLLSNDRGLDTMLAVLAKLLPDFPAMKLHLFGRESRPGVLAAALEHAAVLREAVVFRGHVPQEVARRTLRQCAVGLALLKPVGDYPGSYPGKLFEYMAEGVPVITSDFPLYRSVVETHGCGFCVDLTDVAAIVERICWLIRHPQAAGRMGVAGRQAVRDVYNWKSEADKLVELYQTVDF